MASQFVDHFGKAGANYAVNRPDYPSSVFDRILQYTDDKRDLAIDVGTGTGQAAFPLAKHFKNVIGFEPSAGQLANIKSTMDNLKFVQAPAEKIDLPSESVDLVATAQAIHWFDIPKFFSESHRLLRNNGTLAIWGYGTLTIDSCNESNAIFQDFYSNVIGEKYWPANRKMIDEHYRNINPSPPFSDFVRDDTMKLEKEFNLDSFFGYMETWSGVKEYREKVKDDPLPALHKKLSVTPIGKGTFRTSFPIFLLLAKKIVREENVRFNSMTDY